ncbi:amylo-alpha-1,6-glucosidase domain-containing protein [Ditylenchus destructor]|uniref:Amylo-alpha-1,6-glucosidase domain-containing protein n=1 Tax=Ditylenchus destructor TaxID=166010 RepID=A0AAD4R334_9BILA|nr:amylo-alpha-1,6-glucosidase domain-containing protein [Ditylenchus destructor]
MPKAPTENADHGFCVNLKAGDWLPKYILDRMKLNQKLNKLANFFENKFSLHNAKEPECFAKLFSYLFKTVRHVAIEKISENSDMLKRKTNLDIKQKLAYSSISFMAYMHNSELPQLSTSVVPNKEAKLPTLSAGLPHFVNGEYRNWGRDTFIALPGILLLTGRFEEARHIILGFAGVLRHGLIPNLLNGQGGKQPRYNARDAVWFWLAAIFQYIKIVPKGEKILNDKVRRIFHTDDAKVEDETNKKKEEALKETMHEALRRHFEGIKFRERDAGHAIDGEMGPNGFDVQAYIDHKTGLVFGGSEFNCGTWMDKMGSSPLNMSIPATPRDGAAVELQGLALLTAETLAKLSESGLFHKPGLEAKGTKWTWSEWANILRKSFQDEFFIPKDTKEGPPVNKKGIIKDSFGCSNKYGDYQLRPNFFIAIDAVPDILDGLDNGLDKTWAAIKLAGEKLSGPMGMRTLDPDDDVYRPNYYSNKPGQDRLEAKGWNYHQGPEWLWVAGKYHSAKLKVAHRLKTLRPGNAEAKKAWDDTVAELNERIKIYTKHIEQDVWASLPELTNEDGAVCGDSCNAQAWSVGCFLEALDTYDTLSGSK